MDAYPDPKEIQKSVKIEQIFGPKSKPHDILEFESMLRLEERQIFGDFGFDKAGKIFLSRAPGRLDVMGGIADYSGANVFEAPIERAAVAGCQARKDRLLKSLTYDTERFNHLLNFQVSLDDFYTNGKLNSYAQVHQLFSRNATAKWAGFHTW